MQPILAPELRGTWGTLLLPIAADDSIIWSLLCEEIDALIAARVYGIYSNGTACEFYSQSEDEFDRIHEVLAVKCEHAGLPWQAGVSHMSPQTSLDRVRRARKLKPSAMQVILPDWYPVTNEEAIRFLSRISEEATPIPIVLYNPPHAKRSLAPEDFGVLSSTIPSLIGVKVPHSDRDWCGAFLKHCPRLSLFVPGHELATGITNGAHGAYSNVACLSPAGAMRWNRQIATDPDSALEVERRIRLFMSQHIVPFRSNHGIANQGLDKLLAAIGAWSGIGTRLRWPYSWIPEEEALRLRPVARRLLPELFEGEPI